MQTSLHELLYFIVCLVFFQSFAQGLILSYVLVSLCDRPQSA